MMNLDLRNCKLIIMKRVYAIIITVLGVIITDSDAMAQEELSLSDAIKVGLAQNFDIQIAEKNIELSEIQNTWGQAGLFPSVDIKFSQGNNVSDQSNNPTSFIQALLFSNSLQAAPNLNWVLFNGFQVKANKHKLEQLQAQSEGNAALIIENTVQGIILAYYNANLQREKMDLLKNIIQLSREKFQHEQQKTEFGFGTSVELLQYESAYLTDSSSIVMQELAYKNTIKNLNLFMGVDIKTEWTLSDKLMPETTPYNYDELESKMFANNTNIKNQYINIEILKQDISLAKATMYPVLSFNAGANYATNRYKINDFPIAGQSQVSNGATINYYANFALSFKIFDGGKVKRAIHAVQVQDEITNLNLEKLKLQLSQELSNHYDIYTSRVKIFEISKKAFDVAKRNFEFSKLKENAGLINSFDLRNIELAYLQSGVSLFESVYNLEESKTNLTRLTGGIVSEE